jgi:hypothetical protein
MCLSNVQALIVFAFAPLLKAHKYTTKDTMPYEGLIVARLGDQHTESPLNLLFSGAGCALVRSHPFTWVNFSRRTGGGEAYHSAQHKTGALAELTCLEIPQSHCVLGHQSSEAIIEGEGR